MAPNGIRPLTERQADVMERIDRRMPIKVIAGELGVSETRINQHIRALKNIYGARSLGELVEEYRKQRAVIVEAEELEEEFSHQEIAEISTLKPAEEALTKPVCNKKQGERSVFGVNNDGRDEDEAIEFNDASPLSTRAPWLMPDEPEVVPRVLSGEHAIVLRLAAIVGIASGILLAVLMTVSAAVALSEVTSDHAAVPVDEQGYS